MADRKEPFGNMYKTLYVEIVSLSSVPVYMNLYYSNILYWKEIIPILSPIVNELRWNDKLLIAKTIDNLPLLFYHIIVDLS